MKCLHEPYFYIIPKDHKKKMKISKTMKFRNIDELVKFLKQLFNQLGAFRPLLDVICKILILTRIFDRFGYPRIKIIGEK